MSKIFKTPRTKIKGFFDLNARIRKKSWLVAATIGCLLILAAIPAACDQNDLGQQEEEEEEEPSAVESAFKKMYPDVEGVSWATRTTEDLSRSYRVASFKFNLHRAQAWFTSDGAWWQSLYDTNFDDLSSGIQGDFAAKPYMGDSILCCHHIVGKTTKDLYVICVLEKEKHVDLFYTKYGDFIRAELQSENENDFPIILPEKIEEQMPGLFQNDTYEVVDIWKGSLGTYVGVMNGKTYSLSIFDGGQNWLGSSSKISDIQMPASARHNLEAYLNGSKSKYGTCQISDPQAIDTPQGRFYTYNFMDCHLNRHLAFFDNEGELESILT
ncbi:MAG: hypothetical protein LBL81_04815 [Tannerella sp.]|jgi:hypothetical protein|nr:hypothetical protein [Tannerella sp.]